MSSKYDEVISDSEEEQEMPSFEKSQRAEILSFGSLSAGRLPTVDTSNVSNFTQRFLADTRKDLLLSSGSPMDAISSVNTPTTIGRPRPRPAYKGPNAASNISVINSASSDSHKNGVTSIINDFTLDAREKPAEDITLEMSISERAKLRQRKATKVPQPSEPLPAPLPPPPKPKAKPAPKRKSKSKAKKAKATLFDEVIEITTDDEDELALRSPRFPAQKEIRALTPEHTVPIASSSLPPAQSSQLPPSDPPFSTLPEVPPIITIVEPDTSLEIDERPQSPLFSPKKRKRGDTEERISMPPPPPPLSFSSNGNTTFLLDTTADTSLDDNILRPEVETKKNPKTASKKRGKQKKGVNDGVEGEGSTTKAGRKKAAAVEVVIPPSKIRSPGRNQTSDGAEVPPPFVVDATAGLYYDQEPFGGSDLSGLSEPENVGSSKTKDTPVGKSKKRKARNETQEGEPASKRPTPPIDEEEDVFGYVVEKKAKGKGKGNRILMSDDDEDVEKEVERVPTPPPPSKKGGRKARVKDVVARLPSCPPTEEPVTTGNTKENVRPEPETPQSSPLKSNIRALSANLNARPTKSTPMSELIRRVNSLPGSPFPSTPTLGRTASPLSHSTAYSPYLKSSRSALSRIAPLHPHRRPPPPPLPKPPPPKKTKKQLEMEERWEEELSESVEGWAAMSDEERALLRRQKWDMEMGIED